MTDNLQIYALNEIGAWFSLTYNMWPKAGKGVVPGKVL